MIDSAKAIGYGLANDGDVWDFYDGKRTAQGCLPIGVILTIAAAGSEMSDSSVITNENGWLKRGYSSNYGRARFAVMNPELTMTLPKYQTASGCVDIMMHTMERYFNHCSNMEMTDGISEHLIRTVMKNAKILMTEPDNYDARAEVMWAGSLSHNGLTGCGKEFMMRCHQLEHELSGAYDRVAHGAGLAVIFPAWAKYICTHNISRFAQYAVNVWGIPMNFEHPERTALAGIEATEQYFRSIGMPVRLSELDIDDSRFEEMAEKCTFFGKRTLPDYIEIGKKEMLDIYRLCL